MASITEEEKKEAEKQGLKIHRLEANLGKIKIEKIEKIKIEDGRV